MQFAFLTLQPIKGYLYNNRQPCSFLSGSERCGIVRLGGKDGVQVQAGSPAAQVPSGTILTEIPKELGSCGFESLPFVS